MTTGNENLVRRFYEALATGDTTLLDSCLDPRWEAVPPLRTGPGPEGWKRSIEHLRTVFADLTVTVSSVVSAGEMVAVRSVGVGRHVGELMGVAGTGREVTFGAADFHQVADGRIVRTWHLEDYFGLALQLGLEFTPAPSAAR